MNISHHFSLLLLGVCLTACGSSRSNSDRNDTSVASDSNTVVFNADSAYQGIKTQLDFGPRVPGSKGHAACGDYIVAEMKRHGADTIIEQHFTATNYVGDEMPLRNILARYNTSAPDRVLLVAHWDTRPWADSDPSTDRRQDPVPGANDGASGVAVLMEIGRQLGANAPTIGVDMFFTDGEDSGNSSSWSGSEDTWCLGTQYWVKHMPYAPDSLPRYGILLDMVGDSNARFYREYVSHTAAPQVTDKVWSHAMAAGFDRIFSSDVRGGIVDDHIFINRAGIPCIDIIDCSHPSTGSFPPSWHTINDDLSNISRTTLKAVGQTVLNTIYSEQ